MALYAFQKDDGTVVEQFFPMGKCPKEITCQDGSKAYRIYGCANVTYKGGFLPTSVAEKRNKEMRKRQALADKRMRQSWKSVKKTS